MFRRVVPRFQQRAASGATTQVRREGGPTVAPMMEIHHLTNEASQGGFLLRASLRLDNPYMVISKYPQLGPRKEDPNDMTPQYDTSQRVTVRLNSLHMARLLAVMEGKISGPAAPGRGFPFNLDVKVENEELSIVGRGRVGQESSSKEGVPVSTDFKVNLSGTNLVSFYKFTDSACKASLGFKNVKRIPGTGT